MNKEKTLWNYETGDDTAFYKLLTELTGILNQLPWSHDEMLANKPY